MILEHLNTLTTIIALISAGYIFARIQLRMRALAAGSLLAFGILQMHAGNDGLKAIHLVTNISIICCLVYFANVANNFVALATNVTKIKTDRTDKKKEPQPITDFPPHDYNAEINKEQNVSKR